MTTYVPVTLRRLVIERANQACEYCLIHEDDAFFGCEVDHIIAEKHGGKTTEENLAFSCAPCNRAKGSDIGSLATHTGQLTRLFNPRIDNWEEHMKLDGGLIVPMTAVGEVTVALLKLNTPNRLLEREILIANGDYPPAHLNFESDGV